MSHRVQKSVLENGIRVLSQRVDGVRSVSVGVALDVGSTDESPVESGYAHLVEHMLFQGTSERDARTIAEMMEVGGGAMGAFTARDYTVYHATMLDEYLPFALEVLGDMLCNSVLAEEALERQRAVILNELGRRDDPLRRVNDLLKAALWPNHPLGNPIAGTEKTIRQAQRQTLHPFMRRHYVANRLILTAAGNVEHERFVAQARDSFWQMKPGDSPSPALAPTVNLGSLVPEPRDLQQVYFALAWPAPAYTSSDRYIWHVFTSLLGGGPASRLYRQLREEKGLVYHIAAQYHAYESAGALVIEGSTAPETIIPVLAGTLIEMLRMADEDINLDEHYRAVQSLVSQHLVSSDSAYVRMSRLALQELYFGRPVPSQEVVDGLRAQSPEDIQHIAQSTLDTGMPTIAMVGPVSDPLLQAIENMLADFGYQEQVETAPRHTIAPLAV